MPQGTVHMELFVWWEAPISMRVEWTCASMTSGGQCVMTSGVDLMLLWSVNNWGIHTLEVSYCFLEKSFMPYTTTTITTTAATVTPAFLGGFQPALQQALYTHLGKHPLQQAS